jgi:hypothetical protein
LIQALGKTGRTLVDNKDEKVTSLMQMSDGCKSFFAKKCLPSHPFNLSPDQSSSPEDKIIQTVLNELVGTGSKATALLGSRLSGKTRMLHKILGALKDNEQVEVVLISFEHYSRLDNKDLDLLRAVEVRFMFQLELQENPTDEDLKSCFETFRDAYSYKESFDTFVSSWLKDKYLVLLLDDLPESLLQGEGGIDEGSSAFWTFMQNTLLRPVRRHFLVTSGVVALKSDKITPINLPRPNSMAQVRELTLGVSTPVEAKYFGVLPGLLLDHKGDLLLQQVVGSNHETLTSNNQRLSGLKCVLDFLSSGDVDSFPSQLYSLLDCHDVTAAEPRFQLVPFYLEKIIQGFEFSKASSYHGLQHKLVRLLNDLAYSKTGSGRSFEAHITLLCR